MTSINPSACTAGELLPGVHELDHQPRQRIPYPPGGEGEIGVYGSLTNGQRIARHLAPKVMSGLGVLSGALLRDGVLDPSLREMVIVRVGYRAACAYEVYQHRSLAVRLGVPNAKLDALACINLRGLDESERVVIDFVDEIITKDRPSDAALEGLRGRFNDSHVIELVLVIGLWWTLARMLETSGVPLDSRTIGDHGIEGAELCA